MGALITCSVSATTGISFAVRIGGAHVDFYHGSLAIADRKIYIFNTASCGNA